MRVSVIGTGYLGATHAAAMAELGHDVIGIDTDAAKVARLQEGSVPFFEPGLPELLSSHVATGRLRFSTCPADAADALNAVSGRLDAIVDRMEQLIHLVTAPINVPAVLARKVTGRQKR